MEATSLRVPETWTPNISMRDELIEARDTRRHSQLHNSASGETLISNNGRKPQVIDDMEKQQDDLPPTPVGFWHPELAETRKKVFLKWWAMIAILCTFILGVLSIYWGALLNAYPLGARLTIYLVNFDDAPNAFLGESVMQTFLNQSIEYPNATLGFTVIPGSQFDYDPVKVREAVFHESAYAAVIVHTNATQNLYEAVKNGDSTYDPFSAAELVYNEARDQETYYDFIYPLMNPLAIQAIAVVGERWTRTVMSNSSLNNPEILAKVPQALSPAIQFTLLDLRPFYPPVAIPAVSVGLIYLIIISFFSFGFFMPIHTLLINAKTHRPLKPMQFVFYRWATCIAAYFLMSLAYSFVSLAFQVPFSNPPAPADESATDANAYGKATFFVYWMVNFLGMWALGMACENMAMFVGLPWTSMWLIFWVITNVTTGFYSLDYEPKFYYWGYAWPLRNVVQASRTLLFDTHSRMGLNIGILIAWAAVNSFVYPFASWFMRWKLIRAQKRGQ